jgi:hypothetical protein
MTMQTTTIFSASRRRLVVAVLALALAMGASGVTGWAGPHEISVAAQSNDDGNVLALLALAAGGLSALGARDAAAGRHPGGNDNPGETSG